MAFTKYPLSKHEMDELSNWESDQEHELAFELANWDDEFDPADILSTITRQPPEEQNPAQQPRPSHKQEEQPKLTDTSSQK